MAGTIPSSYSAGGLYSSSPDCPASQTPSRSSSRGANTHIAHAQKHYVFSIDYPKTTMRCFSVELASLGIKKATTSVAVYSNVISIQIFEYGNLQYYGT